MATVSEIQIKCLFENVLLLEKIGLLRQGVIVSWCWDARGAAVYHDDSFQYRLNFDNTRVINYLLGLEEDLEGLKTFIEQLISGY